MLNKRPAKAVKILCEHLLALVSFMVLCYVVKIWSERMLISWSTDASVADRWLSLIHGISVASSSLFFVAVQTGSI